MKAYKRSKLAVRTDQRRVKDKKRMMGRKDTNQVYIMEGGNNSFNDINKNLKI